MTGGIREAMGILSSFIIGIGTTIFVNEGVAAFQTVRQINKRIKMYDADIKWLEEKSDKDFSYVLYLDFMSQHEKENGSMYEPTFIPPTIFYRDERNKYLRAKKRHERKVLEQVKQSNMVL